MRYADSLLTEGENIVLRSRQHWLALLIRGRAAVGLWIIGLLLLAMIVIFNVNPGAIRDVSSGVALVLLVIGVIIFVYRLWQWMSQDYVITNRRLLKVTGILNKRSADSSLEKINDAILTQPMLGRMLNYGDLEILTAAEQAVDLYHMIRDPKGFKKVMLTQKHNLETEFMYGAGRPPSPPLRAPEPMAPAPQQMAPAPQPMAPPPPPAAAPEAVAPAMAAAEAGAAPAVVSPAAPPAPETDESLEVTQTLSRLADLRDSGAITAEEYEQKKDELLNRL